MMNKIGVLVLVAAMSCNLLSTPPVAGQDRAQRQNLSQRFDRLDSDQDGQLVATDVPVPGLFSRLDLNSDGRVTKPEALRAVAQGALTDSNSEPTEASTDDSLPHENRSRNSLESAPIRLGPRPIKPSDFGVGQLVPDLTFTDIHGQQRKLSDYRHNSAVVIALTGTACPLCLKYAPTLAKIERQFEARDVQFLFINPNQSEPREDIDQALASHQFRGPYIQDSEKSLTQALGATTTTEVFVLDRARTLVYRGAVDDQYGFAYSLDKPKTNYLTSALDAVLAEGQPDVEATSAPGCELYFKSEKKEQDSQLTYHNRISRIIQANCIECHRDGGIAPIALETYEQVTDYAGMIRNVVERGIMPPWFAAPNETSTEEDEAPTMHWANDRSLSERDKTDLFAWIKSGAPKGDSADAPLRRVFPDGWLIGKPDAVFKFDQPIPVKATGVMPYQNVTVETHLPEDKWVQAIEVRPGKVDVVHHVIVSVRSDTAEIDERDGYWGVYVPGNSTLVYPDGFAKLLPKGATLRFQMHYTPNGVATEDQTQIGLIYAKEPPRHEVKVAGIANPRIKIPPHADNHREEAKLTLPADVQVLGFLPHMHLRGKAARYELLTASGTETLLDIPQYDFNWQLLYRLAEPQTLRKGDTIRFTGWFDNSENNPANPDPTTTVRWGKQTYDEMHLGYVEYIVPGATPGEQGSGIRKSRASVTLRNLVSSGLFRRLDVNGDGLITRAEVKQRLPGNTAASGSTFDQLDTDGNDELTQEEFAKLRR